MLLFLFYFDALFLVLSSLFSSSSSLSSSSSSLFFSSSFPFFPFIPLLLHPLLSCPPPLCCPRPPPLHLLRHHSPPLHLFVIIIHLLFLISIVFFCFFVIVLNFSSSFLTNSHEQYVVLQFIVWVNHHFVGSQIITDRPLGSWANLHNTQDILLKPTFCFFWGFLPCLHNIGARTPNRIWSSTIIRLILVFVNNITSSRGHMGSFHICSFWVNANLP